MSSFTLPAPPINFTVKRKAFINEESTNKVEFQGSCADGTLFVIWDRARVSLSKEAKALIKCLKPSDQVEVTGKWSAWINSKTAKHRLSFLLEGIETKETSEEDDLDIPKEKEFNFEESDDSLMLKALTYQNDLAKLERRAEGRSNDVRKIIKRSKLSHPSDDDDGEQEVSPGQVPPSSSAGASLSSSAGASSSSSAVAPPSSSASSLSSSKPGRTRAAFTGTHTKFDMDTTQ